MSSSATTTDTDRRTRDAWSRYAERVRDLGGDLYEAAERDAWAELQAALRTIEREHEEGATATAR